MGRQVTQAKQYLYVEKGAEAKGGPMPCLVASLVPWPEGAAARPHQTQYSPTCCQTWAPTAFRLRVPPSCWEDCVSSAAQMP